MSEDANGKSLVGASAVSFNGAADFSLTAEETARELVADELGAKFAALLKTAFAFCPVLRVPTINPTRALRGVRVLERFATKSQMRRSKVS